MQVTVRPMAAGDVDAARAVQVAAFASPGDPTDLSELAPELTARQLRRFGHILSEDPGGCWVADAGGSVVGVALAIRRDDLWGLSLLAVTPDRQAQGIGRGLLEATLTYADACARAVILSTSDPKAMARYAGAGFDLHPQVAARGKPRCLPPADRRVRDGGRDDVALADEVDRAVRGAARYGDHVLLAETWAMFVADDGGSRGYAYVRPNGDVEAVAATDDRTAEALLWRCLRYAVERDVESSIEHVNAAQQWALRVAVDAGLSLRPSGPVFWRGAAPPASYLPSGPWL
ncbi:MAG TPA: GNAT family N-acetyltransferase [Mycobacteriales bacterium]|nr:GNAT family N-acetyltransferase [Mycobacteriales bacterium]